MRLVFAGTPEVSVTALEAIVASGHDLVAVVTRPDAPAGRGRKLVASPVAEYAEKLGVEVLKPVKPSDPDFLARLREIAPDCCPVVAYGGLLPQAALDIPPHGWINLHFSVLPAWRGAAPVQHSIIAGDDVTGASTFRIVKALDAGPVYGVLTEPIGPNDTAGDLLGRLASSGAKLLVDTLDGIEAGILEAREQPAEGVSIAPKLTVEDAEIDLSAPAQRVDRLVRGCNPSPGAWTTFRGERLKVLATALTDEELPPGAIRSTKAAVTVGTGSKAIQLVTVQPQGKKPMAAADWARGVRITDDDRLGAE
ncbi:methionyl-tRNA formyltransferase [Kribbella flavida DSM 17836]|uniref:Methionyl-tRNA formyltransferase n=1 Tax=Kribbella flavida (strain DSM 17836 / JCM 10339 / NBRC 14399) TaxID=479435 RepID=D2PV69_KRIFD|nr:methionyl-tRNA formyltransferase [Kribbella flavida]ADB33350.1 methionyl-tRNA formyltransferase [Kribbella flavida DSM 17836]